MVVLLVICFSRCDNNSRKRIPLLKETYSKNDKNPFGSYVAEQRLTKIFSQYGINVNRMPIDESWYYNSIHSKKENYSLYFLVTKNLILNEDEVSILMDYVKDGNDLFVSADYIDPSFLENIFTSVNRSGEIMSESNGDMKDTHVSMYFGDSIKSIEYSFYYFPFLNFIEDYSDEFVRVLGTNENAQPNYAVYFVGTGRVYLHLAPRAFSNYFLLTGNNYEYFENVISYLRLEPGKIFWDEYYKNSSLTKKRENDGEGAKNFSSLRVIKKNQNLMWAFAIGIVGMILFLSFEVKRRQRIIPERKPNSNATIEFTETIGRLYYQHKNNRRIADKMVTYFNEHVRNKYFLNTAVINEEFINSLAGKSGITVGVVEELYALIRAIQSQQNVSDDQLLSLHLKIENFNKIK